MSWPRPRLLPMLLAAGVPFMTGLPGCGALFNERERVVTIESTPPGAEVQVEGERAGRTPLQITVRTDKSTSVIVQGRGQAETCQVEAEIEPLWVILDLWFLVPLIVDAATGRWNDVPDRCVVALDGAQRPPPVDAPDTRPPAPRPKPQPKPTVPPANEPPPPKPGKTQPFPFPK